MSQVYRLLPKKNFHSIRSRDPTEEDGEKCISAEDITHNGIVYTPKEVLDDDDAYSIFEVMFLPKITTETDFYVFANMEKKWTSKL